MQLNSRVIFIAGNEKLKQLVDFGKLINVELSVFKITENHFVIY